MDYAAEARATFTNVLTTLKNLAAKAQTAGHDDAVLGAKLADDMFPLETQFRIAINQVYLCLGRVCPPEIALDETPYASLDAVQTALTEALSKVSASADAAWLPADTSIDFTLPNNMRFVMSASEYVRDWTMPNFYFHATTAYALLRQAGLGIGKIDFIPHMARYMRGSAA